MPGVRRDADVTVHPMTPSTETTPAPPPSALKRITRVATNIAALASLLMCIGLVALWIRSHATIDDLIVARGGHLVRLNSQRAVLVVEWTGQWPGVQRNRAEPAPRAAHATAVGLESAVARRRCHEHGEGKIDAR
jgi:hypothetical protein